MRNFIDLINNSFDEYQDHLDVDGISKLSKGLFEAKGSDMVSNGNTEEDEKTIKRRRRLTASLKLNTASVDIVQSTEETDEDEDDQEDAPQ